MTRRLRLCTFQIPISALFWAFSLGLLIPDTYASPLRRSAIVKAVEAASPSIVNIDGQKTISRSSSGFSKSESHRVKGMGTGVFIDQRGYILTNFHVVQGVRVINVKLFDGSSTVARLVAHDPVTDLAIIKVRISRKIPLMRIGSSKDLMLAEDVIAIGNAYGYEHSVTRGIISSLHRSVQVDEKQRYYDLIQTDASINPGNSGGPLLNIDGELIGINVAVRVGAQGIGFAIPVDKAMAVAAQLMNAGRISGVDHGIIPDVEKDPESNGVIALAVNRHSPASKAGVQNGDVITEVNGFKVQRVLDLERAFIGIKPGEVVQVSVNRDGRAANLELQLSEANDKEADSPTHEIAWRKLGLRLTELTKKEIRHYKSRISVRKESSFEFDGGLRVTNVRAGSDASQQGIRSGDVLVGLHKWKTLNFDNIEYVLNEPTVGRKQSLAFYVVRGSKTLVGQLPVNWK